MDTYHREVASDVFKTFGDIHDVVVYDTKELLLKFAWNAFSHFPVQKFW